MSPPRPSPQLIVPTWLLCSMVTFSPLSEVSAPRPDQPVWLLISLALTVRSPLAASSTSGASTCSLFVLVMLDSLTVSCPPRMRIRPGAKPFALSVESALRCRLIGASAVPAVTSPASMTSPAPATPIKRMSPATVLSDASLTATGPPTRLIDLPSAT